MNTITLFALLKAAGKTESKQWTTAAGLLSPSWMALAGEVVEPRPQIWRWA